MPTDTYAVCASWFTTNLVPGRGGLYAVSVNLFSPPTCTCPAFHFSEEQHKWCKHVDAFVDGLCLWCAMWDHVKDPPDDDRLYPADPEGFCPQCRERAVLRVCEVPPNTPPMWRPYRLPSPVEEEDRRT